MYRLLIIDQPAAQTAEANHRPKGASLNVERLLHWPGAAPLLRGAMVAIFAFALGMILVHFGQIGRQAALSSSSQPESAPMAPPAIAQIPDAFSHRRFVDAGAPAVVRGDALSYSGHHDPSTVAPDEQPVKPPSPSRCTQTYKVPSERGGEASIGLAFEEVDFARKGSGHHVGLPIAVLPLTLTPLPANRRKRRFLPPPKVEAGADSQNGSNS